MEELRAAVIGVLLWPVALLAVLMIFVAWLGG